MKGLHCGFGDFCAVQKKQTISKTDVLETSVLETGGSHLN